MTGYVNFNCHFNGFPVHRYRNDGFNSFLKALHTRFKFQEPLDSRDVKTDCRIFDYHTIEFFREIN